MEDRKEPSPARKDFVHLENFTFETRELFQREMGDIRAGLEDRQEAGQLVDEVEPLRQAAAACRPPAEACGGGSGVKSGFVFPILRASRAAKRFPPAPVAECRFPSHPR